MSRRTLMLLTWLVAAFYLPIDSHAQTDSRRPQLYLAGPLGFTEAGRYFQYQYLVKKLQTLGFEVIDPWRLTDQKEVDAVSQLPYGAAKRDAWAALNPKIGKNNQAGIDRADAVLAILDGVDVDSGTAAEIGYAFARGKIIAGYRNDFRVSGDNEGTVINLQVQYFIEESGGKIVERLSDLPKVLSNPMSIKPVGTLATNNSASARSYDSGGDERTEPTRDFIDVVDFFKKAFAIVAALAISEALKQFVADKAQSVMDTVIQWNRLPALLSFLILIFPFFQGMNRYFSVTYGSLAETPQPYAKYLMIDGSAFLIESAIFFIISRALSDQKWRTFYVSVLGLLAIDSIWGLWTYLTHLDDVVNWVLTNIVFSAILVITLIYFYKSSYYKSLAWLCCVIITTRTVVDYWINWHFYFPKP